MLADFLEALIELGDAPRGRRRRLQGHGNLARRLEEEILGGAVEIKSSDTGYPSFHYRPNGWKSDLPLMNTSSMVSELAPVVLFLRHVVRRGDVLIIEEPESHLHPAMQVAFTRLLAAAVRSGIRIIVTTHSEWVLESLANLVRLSEVPEGKRHDFDGADLALAPHEAGAWLFEPRPELGGSGRQGDPPRHGIGHLSRRLWRDHRVPLQRLGADLQSNHRGLRRMPSPLAQVDRKVVPGCLACACGKRGCNVELGDAPRPFRLIDMDHADSPAGARATRCDYLFIAEDHGDTRLYVVPLELKSSGLDIGRVRPQLEAGARIAERVVPRTPSTRFIPVAVHGRRLPRKKINDLRKSENSILFRKHRYQIQLIRCGDSLSQALR